MRRFEFCFRILLHRAVIVLFGAILRQNLLLRRANLLSRRAFGSARIESLVLIRRIVVASHSWILNTARDAFAASCRATVSGSSLRMRAIA